MIRVVYASPQTTDTPSFYRGWGPLCELSKRIDNMALYHSNQFNWASVRMSDVFCFARNWTDGCVESIKMCKAQDKFVWVDYDDSFLRIPESNPNYADLADAGDNIREVVSLADVITVSTPALKEDFAFVKEKVFVVPNAYDDDFLGPMKAPESYSHVVVWRGSATHDEDLAPIADSLVKFIDSPAFNGWEFHFMGHNPAYITSRIKNSHRIEVVPPKDIVQYFQNIKNVKPALFIVPLKDTPFNRCKSNIAWIEATYAGAMTLASDLPEFRRPGVALTDESVFVRDLGQHIKAIEEKPDYILNHWKFSHDAIPKLSEVNNARLQIIRNGYEISRGKMGRPSRPDPGL